MKVHCPNCKASYKIEDSKIPEKGAHLNCPKCKTRFFIKKESEGVGKVCPNCGYERQPKDDKFTPALECPKCGIIYSKAKNLTEKEEQQNSEESDVEPADEDDSIENETEEPETKNCPYCAEEIKAEAIKCRFCGESLVNDGGAQDKATPSKMERIDSLIEKINSLSERIGSKRKRVGSKKKRTDSKRKRKGCRTGCGFLVLIGFIAIGLATMIPELYSPPEKTNDRVSRPPRTIPKRKPVPRVAKQKHSMEYTLAFLDGDGYIPEDHSSVARFRSLLHQLSSTYNADKDRIGNATVAIQNELKKMGIHETLLNLLEGMNRIYTSRKARLTYEDCGAAYLMLRNKGYSHRETIIGIKAFP